MNARAWFYSQSFHSGGGGVDDDTLKPSDAQRLKRPLASNGEDAFGACSGDNGADTAQRVEGAAGWPGSIPNPLTEQEPGQNRPATTYDFPWGTRPICPNEHERSIGGDGYGDRCCGNADVMVVQESDPDCARHLCESCCDDTCCRACHAVSVLEDAEYCAACQVDQEMARRADEDCDRPQRLDDRTAADRFYDRWKAAREDGR